MTGRTLSSRYRSRLIGDKTFYKAVLVIVLPIIVQNTVANFVNLLDNLMVGRIGTEPMSGVSVANQLVFVYNLCIFGGLAGAGIFSAQYHGAGNTDGVRYTFRFKLITGAVLLVIAVGVLTFAGTDLIKLYLTEDTTGIAEETLQYGQKYLRIILFGLAPFALSQSYSGTLRETGETMLPMKASIAEVLTNLVFNYILIFGKLGIRPMGVEGAAIATVISRMVGLAILMIYTHTHTERHPFIVGAYRSLYIPKVLTMDVIRKGMPLLANECLWSIGTVTLVQQYSLRGLIVIAALNISSTISNMFNVVFMSMGNAVGIMVGQALGANDIERAKNTAWRLVALSLVSCVVFGILLSICSPFLPMFYNTTDDVRSLASRFILCSAALMPIYATAHCFYFTLRSGGKTIITFLFDCVFSWAIMIPTAWILVHLTNWPIVAIYFCCQGSEFVKVLIGYVLVRKGVWIHNIVRA